MSAIAFHISDDNIYLLSDGIAIDQSGAVTDRDCCKAFVQNNMGILWPGLGGPDMHKAGLKHIQNAPDPETAIHSLADFIRYQFADRFHLIEIFGPIEIYTVGWDESGAYSGWVLQVDKPGRAFSIKNIPVGNGFTWFRSQRHQIHNTRFMEHLQECFATFNGQADHQEKTLRSAFERTLTDIGGQVGGQTFFKTVQKNTYGRIPTERIKTCILESQNLEFDGDRVVEGTFFNLNTGELKSASFDLVTDQFRLNAQGLRLNGSANFETGSAVRFFNSEATNPDNSIGGLVGYGTGGNRQLRLTAGNGYDLGFSTNEGNHIRFTQVPGGLIFLHGLPTSDPQLAGALWRDGTDLRVSSITVSIPNSPGQPSLCRLTNGLDRVQISWSNVSGATSYNVERNDGTGWQQFASTSSTSVEDYEPPTNPTSQYAYRVRACNSAGCSAAGNSAAGIWNSLPNC